MGHWTMEEEEEEEGLHRQREGEEAASVQRKMMMKEEEEEEGLHRQVAEAGQALQMIQAAAVVLAEPLGAEEGATIAHERSLC